METKSLYKNLSSTAQQRNLLLFISSTLLISNLVLAIYLNLQETKVIVVPTHVAKEFEVGTREVSSEYLELMARDVVNSLLNVTADNIEYFEDNLLKMAHPKFHGELRQQLSELSQDVKKRQVRLHYRINELALDTPSLTAEISGYLETFIGLKQTSMEIKKYIVGFDYTGARLMLTKFYEVTEEENGKQEQ